MRIAVLRTCLSLTLAVSLPETAFAGWPDPRQTGQQDLVGIRPDGGLALTDAEAEFLAARLGGAYAETIITDIGLSKEIGEHWGDEYRAAHIFGYAAGVLYVFEARADFKAAATRSPMSGSRRFTSRMENRGSVLLGVDFLKALHKQSGNRWRLAYATIMYHEMAHVFLLNRNIDRGSRGNEALADRLAGYCIGLDRKILSSDGGVLIDEDAISELADIKVFAGNPDSVHGSIAERIERFKEGYWQGYLGVNLEDALAQLDHG